MFAVSHYRYFWILGLCYAAQGLGSFIISFRIWVSHCVLVLGLKFEILHYKFSCSGFGICGFWFFITKFSCLGFGFEPWRFGYGLFHHKFLYLCLGIRNCDFEFFKIIDCLVLVYKNIILNLKLKQKWWSHRLFCCLANGFPFRHGRFCALRRVVTNKSTSSRWILYSAPF